VYAAEELLQGERESSFMCCVRFLIFLLRSLSRSSAIPLTSSSYSIVEFSFRQHNNNGKHQREQEKKERSRECSRAEEFFGTLVM
jgi:hypothetical protein